MPAALQPCAPTVAIASSTAWRLHCSPSSSPAVTRRLPVTESARNHFLGLVTDVVTDGVMAHVKLQAGPFRISSLISSEAVRELHLEPGMLAVASVKATNVVIELPPPTETQPRKP